MQFEVIFYETRLGKCPIEEFLNSLEIKHRAKMVGLIEILEQQGNFLREPYSKPLGDKLFELRCDFGNDASRIVYFFYDGGRIILTNGFVKKSQKTPRNVIELAQKYRNDFYQRGGL